MMNLEEIQRKLTIEKEVESSQPIPPKTKEINPEEINSKEVKEKSKTKDFQNFMNKVLKALEEDNVLRGMRLKGLNSGTFLILYQGVRSNTLARFYPNRYQINWGLIKNRLKKLINEYYQ